MRRDPHTLHDLTGHKRDGLAIGIRRGLRWPRERDEVHHEHVGGVPHVGEVGVAAGDDLRGHVDLELARSVVTHGILFVGICTDA